MWWEIECVEGGFKVGFGWLWWWDGVCKMINNEVRFIWWGRRRRRWFSKWFWDGWMMDEFFCWLRVCVCFLLFWCWVFMISYEEELKLKSLGGFFDIEFFLKFFNIFDFLLEVLWFIFVEFLFVFWMVELWWDLIGMFVFLFCSSSSFMGWFCFVDLVELFLNMCMCIYGLFL